MPPPQIDTPNANEDSLPLDHSHILLTSFNSFLTVAIHNILYYRNIYPPSTFLSTKAYNLPVHQNRHPKVCAWVRDAVDAVAVQLSTGHVSRIANVIHSPLEATLPPPSPSSQSQQQQQSQSTTSFTPTPSHPQQQAPPAPPPPPPGSVLERWLISTTHFPRWPTPTSTAAQPSKSQAAFSRILARDSRSEEARERHLAPDPLNPSFSWPDLDEQLRGALRRMASTAEGMGALPVAGCGFTVAVELGEVGRAPLGVSLFSLSSFAFFISVFLAQYRAWSLALREFANNRKTAPAGLDTVRAEPAATG
jgi:mitotic spindle assembly checkpoint protein MAD2B